MPSDPLSRPLIVIERDLREMRASARELIEAAIARHERFGERLHAYSFWAPDQARVLAEAAHAAFSAGVSTGPLQGLPISVKDLFAAGGYPCFAGSRRRLPADPWERDGPLVATLRRQLGVIMGKTHMVEFAFGGTGQNSHHGTPYNPWDATAHRSVGGSSSGAGVSLLEGSAVLAFGSDTAGSVRIPACMTGNAGLKVTIGRWSTEGIVPLSFTFDTPGLLARSVCDLAYGFAALDPARIDPSGLIARGDRCDLTGVRIGVGEPFLWHDCDPGIAETVQDAVDTLVRAGAIARDFTLPEAEAAYGVFLDGGLSAVELCSFLDRELPEWLDQLDPVIAPAVRNAERQSARDYLARVARLDSLAQAASPRIDAVDIIASPTLCLTPPLMSDVADAESHLRVNRRIVHNTLLGQLSRALRDHDAGRPRPRRHARRAAADRARQCRGEAADNRADGRAPAWHRRRPAGNAAAARFLRPSCPDPALRRAETQTIYFDRIMFWEADRSGHPD